MRTRGLAWLAPWLAVAGCGARTPLDHPELVASLDGGTTDVAFAPLDGFRRPDAPDAALSCAVGAVTLSRARVDLVFALDRSGSMSLGIGGDRTSREAWRWTILRSALERAVDVLDERISVGAMLFPNPDARPRPDLDGPCLVTVGLDVPVAAGGARAMLARMAATEPAGGTPTALAIDEVRSALERSPAAHRAIVLATDGAPNCNPDLITPGCVCTVDPGFCEATGGGAACLDATRSVSLVRQTWEEAHIPVYVVGIDEPVDPVLGDVLDRMAVAGGRPRDDGPHRFHAVHTATELEDALREITETVSLCAFALGALPPRDETLTLTLDGEVLVPGEGWSWAERARGELEIRGEACGRVRGGSRLAAEIRACD